MGGNSVDLKNPDVIPDIVEGIEEQQKQYGDTSKFLFCLHIGTTADESIKIQRPEFMEGRATTLINIMQAFVDSMRVVEEVYEHFRTTRFAGLVIKVYKGNKDPGCAKDDLVPPGDHTEDHEDEEPET